MQDSIVLTHKIPNITSNRNIFCYWSNSYIYGPLKSDNCILKGDYFFFILNIYLLKSPIHQTQKPQMIMHLLSPGFRIHPIKPPAPFNFFISRYLFCYRRGLQHSQTPECQPLALDPAGSYIY